MSGDVLTLVAAVLVRSALYWVVPWVAVRAALRRARAVGPRLTNYRARPVTLGLGWAWFAWGVVAALPALTAPVRPGGQADVGVLVAGVALLGWLDDRHGTGAARGFRGHFAALRRGSVTTGVLKLVGTVGIALAVAYALPVARGDAAVWGAQRLVVWIAGAAVIALTANLVNLLDLRPGRALKAYVLLALPAYVPLALASVRPGWRWSLPLAAMVASGSLLVLGPVLACWRADVGETAMLGDMGANAAGALAGWLLARVLPIPALVGAAVVLFALNLASERVSFSAVIAGSAPLRWLDLLGRGGDAETVARPLEGDAGS